MDNRQQEQAAPVPQSQFLVTHYDLGPEQAPTGGAGNSLKDASGTRQPALLHASNHCRETTSWHQVVRSARRLRSFSVSTVSAPESTRTWVQLRLRFGVYLHAARVLLPSLACSVHVNTMGRHTSSHRPPAPSTSACTRSLTLRRNPLVVATTPSIRMKSRLSKTNFQFHTKTGGNTIRHPCSTNTSSLFNKTKRWNAGFHNNNSNHAIKQKLIRQRRNGLLRLHPRNAHSFHALAFRNPSSLCACSSGSSNKYLATATSARILVSSSGKPPANFISGRT